MSGQHRYSPRIGSVSMTSLAKYRCRGYGLPDAALLPNSWEDSTMSVKQASKGKRRSKAVPVLGAAAAGLSFSLVGGASAVTVGPAADMPATPNTLPGQQITLGEEEMSDVSLSTFYVFDKENTSTLRSDIQLARGGCGGRGCGGRGCGGRGCGGRGCGGCGGCGCWCISTGGCRLC
jgi:hypothetical protein